MSDKPESISQEQYNTLIEKLEKVEGKLGDGIQESVTKLTEKMGEFKKLTETLQEELDTLKGVEVPEITSTEAIQKMINETVKPVSDGQAEMKEKIEKTPYFKGPGEGEGDPEPKERDVLKGVFKTAYPEVR